MLQDHAPALSNARGRAQRRHSRKSGRGEPSRADVHLPGRLRALPADSAAVKEAYFDQQLQDAARHSEIQWTDACAALNSETFWNAVKRGESID